MTEQNDETPLCGAQFGSKSCCLAAGHPSPWHTSRSGSSWPTGWAAEATLASEATRWSRCETISRCEEIRDHYDGEKVPSPPLMPCGCGDHDVRVNGMTIHWLGSHWDADCAFQRALGLLAKALDAKETDE